LLLKFDNEAEWLEARKQDVTSTEVAALFGLNPYKSRLRLWHEKAGTIEPDFVESDGTKWGRRLQIPVGMGICEDECWTGDDLTGFYARDPVRRLGSSFDLGVVSIERGRGLLEVKIADNFREDDGWFKDKAPLHYEFQIQNEMHCARIDTPEVNWGALGCLGKRQAVRLYIREYDAKVGDLINEEVESFWRSITAGRPPKPDYTVDSDLLESLRKPLRSGDVINLSTNNRAMDLAASYDNLREIRGPLQDQIDVINAEMDTIKSELWAIIGRNEKAIIGPYTIGARETKVEEFINYGHTRRGFSFNKKKGQ